MSVRLHIERLVLDGFDLGPHDRARFVASIESELARLVGNGGISPALANGIAVPTVTAPDATFAPNAKPAQMGAAVAASLYRGVGR